MQKNMYPQICVGDLQIYTFCISSRKTNFKLDFKCLNFTKSYDYFIINPLVSFASCLIVFHIHLYTLSSQISFWKG